MHTHTRLGRAALALAGALALSSLGGCYATAAPYGYGSYGYYPGGYAYSPGYAYGGYNGWGHPGYYGGGWRGGPAYFPHRAWGGGPVYARPVGGGWHGGGGGWHGGGEFHGGRR